MDVLTRHPGCYTGLIDEERYRVQASQEALGWHIYGGVVPKTLEGRLDLESEKPSCSKGGMDWEPS